MNEFGSGSHGGSPYFTSYLYASQPWRSAPFSRPPTPSTFFSPATSTSAATAPSAPFAHWGGLPMYGNPRISPSTVPAQFSVHSYAPPWRFAPFFRPPSFPSSDFPHQQQQQHHHRARHIVIPSFSQSSPTAWHSDQSFRPFSFYRPNRGIRAGRRPHYAGPPHISRSTAPPPPPSPPRYYSRQEFPAMSPFSTLSPPAVIFYDAGEGTGHNVNSGYNNCPPSYFHDPRNHHLHTPPQTSFPFSVSPDPPPFPTTPPRADTSSPPASPAAVSDGGSEPSNSPPPPPSSPSRSVLLFSPPQCDSPEPSSKPPPPPPPSDVCGEAPPANFVSEMTHVHSLPVAPRVGFVVFDIGEPKAVFFPDGFNAALPAELLRGEGDGGCATEQGGQLYLLEKLKVETSCDRDSRHVVEAEDGEGAPLFVISSTTLSVLTLKKYNGVIPSGGKIDEGSLVDVTDENAPTLVVRVKNVAASFSPVEVYFLFLPFGLVVEVQLKHVTASLPIDANSCAASDEILALPIFPEAPIKSEATITFRKSSRDQQQLQQIVEEDSDAASGDVSCEWKTMLTTKLASAFEDLSMRGSEGLSLEEADGDGGFRPIITAKASAALVIPKSFPGATVSGASSSLIQSGWPALDLTAPGICFDHQRGRCKRGDHCRFRHTNPGECFDFHTKSCDRGGACPYKHVVCIPFSNGADASGGARNMTGGTAGEWGGGTPRKFKRTCFDWLRGSCDREARCKFRHDVEVVFSGAVSSVPIGERIGKVLLSRDGYGGCN